MNIGRDRAAGLLHNMSAPPKTVVKFDGLGVLDGSGAAKSPAVFGTAVRFRLAPEWRRLPLARFLRRLEPDCRLRAAADRAARVLELIERRAAELPLPEGCVLIRPGDDHAEPWGDPLSALAVLAKCTDTVWLRGKSPSLLAAQERADVSLLVPPAFAVRLPSHHRPTPTATGDHHEE